MDNKPDYKFIEPKINKFWLENNIFSFDKNKGNVYSIDTPPPTISGNLHIGHGLSYSHIDIIARFQRMNGKNVFFPMGFDDNGLPTERYVEKKRGISSKHMSREDFVKVCLEKTNFARDDYKEVWSKLGFSVDWDYSYSTINELSQKISQQSFIDLYEKGLVSLKEEPSLWCPNCETTVAEAELDDVVKKAFLHYLPFSSPEGDIMIATTRPELLGACVGVFVNPNDARYSKFIDKTVTVPIFNYEVKVYKSEKVDPEFGTGATMVCTFGDKTDIELWKEYNLETKIIFNSSGLSNLEGLNGFSKYQLRDKIVGLLKEHSKLSKIEELAHTEKLHERCSSDIEYYVKNQWFIDVLNHKEEFIEAADRINWHPEGMKQRYVNWVNNLKWDWSISRQRLFGVPFPIWYDKHSGKTIVADRSMLPVDPQKTVPKGYNAEDLIAETDVMDTWMTSSVTPLINSKWMQRDGLDLTPMSLRPQAHDIIRSWAFYTIVKNIYHTGNIPWKDIVISGHGLDSKGQKMSKSKNNIIKPLDVVERYSADALRLWAGGSKLGSDSVYNDKEISSNQSVLIKLWNVARFASMHLDDLVMETSRSDNLMDKWILDKQNQIILESTNYFNNFEFSKARQVSLDFFKHDFADNYLEAIKYRLYSEDEVGIVSKQQAKNTLINSVETILKLFAPFIPYTTEEIYQDLFRKGDSPKSVHLAKWPEYQTSVEDLEARRLGNDAVEIFSLIRAWKSKNSIRLGEEVASLNLGYYSLNDFNLIKETVEKVLRVKDIKFHESPKIEILG